MRRPLDRLDASAYGDPEDHQPDVAPPCDECGLSEAVGREDGRDLCADCLEGGA